MKIICKLYVKGKVIDKEKEREKICSRSLRIKHRRR